MSEDRSTSPTQVIAAGVTDVGRTREINEDNILVEPTLGLYVVADGMGGHSAGDVASTLAAKTLTEYFRALKEAEENGTAADPEGVESASLPRDAQKLVSAIRKANHEIYSMSSLDSRHKGMGSTVVALLVSPDDHQVHIAHVGDSRCYRVRRGLIEQMTRDHSLINEALAMKPDLTKAQIARLPKNVITRALGMASGVQVDIRTEQALPGDQFLLCSDGLSGLVNEQQMLDMLEMSDTAESACEVLIALANDAGGTDNISALVVRVPGEPEESAEESLGTPETPAVGMAELHAETVEEAAEGGELSVAPAVEGEVVQAAELSPDDLSASEQFAVAELLRQSEEAEAAAASAEAREVSPEDLSESEQLAVSELLRQAEEAEAAALAGQGEAEGEEGVIEEGEALAAEEAVLEEGEAAEEAVIEEGAAEEEGVIEEGVVEEGVIEEGLLEEALAAEQGLYEEPVAEAPVDDGEAVVIAPIIDISPPAGTEAKAEAPKPALPEPEASPVEAEVQVEAAEAGDVYSEFGDTYVGDDADAAQMDRERSPISIVPVARCRRCRFELYIGNAFCTECGLRID